MYSAGSGSEGGHATGPAAVPPLPRSRCLCSVARPPSSVVGNSGADHRLAEPMSLSCTHARPPIVSCCAAVCGVILRLPPMAPLPCVPRCALLHVAAAAEICPLCPVPAVVRSVLAASLPLRPRPAAFPLPGIQVLPTTRCRYSRLRGVRPRGCKRTDGRIRRARSQVRRRIFKSLGALHFGVVCGVQSEWSAVLGNGQTNTQGTLAEHTVTARQ